ncbi:response regulator, partial [bacterium]|nr:response regulator [bacterium]
MVSTNKNERIPAGIHGLDEILEGGFKKASTILLVGSAGVGKTTFCMQSLFNAVSKNDETCVFISMISEQPQMIKEHMSNYSFYDPDVCEKQKMQIIGINSSILDKGDFAVFEFIEDQLHQLDPAIVAIDPVTILEHTTKSFEGGKLEDGEKRNFILKFLQKVKKWNTLVLMTSEFPSSTANSDLWSYLVDGIIVLDDREVGNKRERYLEVTKMRGVRYLRGKHLFEIKDDGITVFPPLPCSERPTKMNINRISAGISELDNMVGGGLFQSSTTLVTGNGGTGKSNIGLHFINEGLKNGEACIIVLSEESAADIIRYAAGFGWDFETFVDAGFLKLISIESSCCIGEVAQILRTEIENANADRIFMDCITGLAHKFHNKNELLELIKSFVKYFKSNSVTSIFTNENLDILGNTKTTEEVLSFMLDSVISVRYVEIDSEIKRAISVVKMKGSDHDKRIREFVINEGGIEIGLPFSEHEGVSSGAPHRVDRRKKLLIVDDEPHILKIIKGSLINEPYDITEARNGKEALSKVFTEAPDAIVLDIMMPEMDGWNVAAELKKNPQWKSIPIVFLTAKTDSSSKTYGKIVSADYIEKPFEIDDLKRRIDK